MKIKEITWEKVRAAMEPFTIAFATIDAAEIMIVKVTTDDGIVGYGEASPFSPVTGETIDSVDAFLKAVKPGLIGTDPFAIERIHAGMDHTFTGNGAAKCAVDLAMYDIMGKAAGQPVWKMIGGYRSEIENDTTIGIMKPEEMAAQAVHFVKDCGYRILKVKVGIDPDADIRALRLIREAVGPDVRLRVDANQGYDVEEAVYALEGFKKAGVDAAEQCLPWWDRAHMAELKRKVSGIRIMLDEAVHDEKDAAALLAGGCADILNIKLMKCGGILPGLKIADVAGAFGATCMVGCMMESRLAITAGLSLIASRACASEADCDSYYIFDDAKAGITGGFVEANGVARLSDEPGFGVSIGF